MVDLLTLVLCCCKEIAECYLMSTVSIIKIAYWCLVIIISIIYRELVRYFNSNHHCIRLFVMHAHSKREHISMCKKGSGFKIYRCFCLKSYLTMRGNNIVLIYTPVVTTHTKKLTVQFSLGVGSGFNKI